MPDPTGNGPVCNKRSFFSTFVGAASSSALKGEGSAAKELLKEPAGA